jgi:cysteine-rich repeat protein
MAILARMWLVPLAWGLVVGGCDSERDCGDGVVTDGEACDDGNVLPGDGCSANCEPDDDLSTPGDDRAGYFYCGDELTGGVTCQSGTLCCLTGSRAVPRVRRAASTR